MLSPLNFTSLHLAHLHAEALFVHDANGRLLRINEPDPTSPASRFFLVSTRDGNLWRTRHDLPPEFAAELEYFAAQEPVGIDHLPRHAGDYAAVLGKNAPIIGSHAGPAFYLPELAPSGKAVPITPQNIHLLQTHFAWLSRVDDYAPVSAVVVDGSAVAICFSSRIAPQVCEAGVYTEAAYRGHGYATDAVRGWAAALRASGRLPLYSTSWDNFASQSIARKLGAVQYAVEFSLT